MRKIAAFLCVAVLLTGLLAGCGGSSSNESRVELTKNGKITEYTVEDFSASNYDEAELKEFIKEAIAEFRVEYKGRIRVRRQRIKKTVAYLTIHYNSAETYSAFNDTVCFEGTIGEALEAGYDFSMNFTAAEDSGSRRKTETADEDEEDSAEERVIGRKRVSGTSLISDDSLKLLVIGTNEDVRVPGDVQYYYCSLGSAEVEKGNTVVVYSEADNNLVYVLYK